MEADLNYIYVSHLRDFEDNSFNLEDLTHRKVASVRDHEPLLTGRVPAKAE